jgi:hypothetical protein
MVRAMARAMARRGATDERPMTWLAPGFLAAGVLAAMTIVALHLLAWRRPPEATLPTARFVPDAPARARARSRRPADPWLLALRVLALLLIATALARPVRVPPRAVLARVILVDRSASVADEVSVRAALRAEWRTGDAIVAFDTAARAIATPDSLGAQLERPRVPGRLSAALVAAHDAARALAERADSVELLLVSPLLREEVDAATAAAARGWGGRARVVRVTAEAPSATAPSAIDVDAPLDDAIGAGVDAGGIRARAAVRLVRRDATAADSAWLGGDRGRVLVAWRRAEAAPGRTSVGLTWSDDAIVAPIAPDGTPAPGRIIARWADGAAAAVERPFADGCVREVRVAVPRAGDVTLSPGFARLLAYLVEPCGGPRDRALVDPLTLGLRAAGPAMSLRRPVPRDPWAAARWLLGAAALLLLIEPLLRGSARAVAEGQTQERRGRDGAAEAA